MLIYTPEITLHVTVQLSSLHFVALMSMVCLKSYSLLLPREEIYFVLHPRYASLMKGVSLRVKMKTLLVNK